MRQLVYIFLGALFLGALILLALNSFAFGQVETSSVSGVSVIDPALINTDMIESVIKLMALAFKKGNYKLAFGLLLTVAVGVARLVGITKFFDRKHDKWVAAALAVATGLAVGLQAGKSWTTILVTSATVALVAIGGWEVVGMYLQRGIDAVLRKMRGEKAESAS
jgi:hypothetical protein